MNIDFHCHTTASDGTLEPAALIDLAREREIDMLSITDHDTLAAYQTLADIDTGLRIIPGIELSSQWNRRGVHIVGLNVDTYSSSIIEAVTLQSQAREDRAEIITERLARLGFADCLEGAKSFSSGPQVGRPHFAQHLVAIGAVSNVQQAFTALKVLLILLFCAVIFIWGGTPQSANFMPQAGDEKLLFSGAFAVALIYVNYAYTGWNAATYVTSELDNPQRNLPIVLFVGTGVVMMLYLLLNFTFLSAAPMGILEGRLEVGVIVADHALGDSAGKAMGAVLALLLISTVSAMTMAGPRVLQVIGEDFSLFSKLARCNRHGVPMTAIIFQGLLALLFIVSATFESVLIFSSFVLGVNTLFSVLGVFVLRWKKLNIKGAYKTFAYPFAPLIYLSVTLWTLVYVLLSRPQEGLLGLGIIGAGAIVYYLSVDKTAQDSGR